MKIGFTGTQRGMTQAQVDTLTRTLREHAAKEDEASEFHHGDCVGADATAHRIADACGLRIIVHPPDKDEKRAFCEPYDAIRKPKPYLTRNRDIVNETEVLVATPRGTAEEVRSGTWMTVRYGLDRKRPVTMIWPDGSLETWRWDDELNELGQKNSA